MRWLTPDELRSTRLATSFGDGDYWLAMHHLETLVRDFYPTAPDRWFLGEKRRKMSLTDRVDP